MSEPSTWADFSRELDAAIQAHMDWGRRVLRCAVLLTPPGEDVLEANSHQLCRLGRWLSQNRSFFDALDSEKTDALDTSHRNMHDAIRDICNRVLRREAGSEESLQAFEDSQIRLIEYLSYFKTVCTQIDSQIDPLTGLALRHHLEHKFELLKRRCSRANNCAAIVLIDIDHFKAINDRHGHMGGDLVLKETAKCLKRNLRESDEAYRYGGDELLVLVELNSVEEAHLTAERLLGAIRAQTIISNDGAVIHLTATIGVAKVHGTESINEVLQRADAALYLGKQRGRNRYVLAAEGGEGISISA